MTLVGSTDSATRWQHDETVLRGWAERLASVDMWQDAARLVLAALPGTPVEGDRLNAAWVCLRGGRPHEARRLMEPVTSTSPSIQVLRAAADALCDLPDAYDTFLQALMDAPEGGMSAYRLAALCAAHHEDWDRANDAARRLLAATPQDADMLVLIAADLAVQGCWQQALAAVERARSDRFTCQTDPAQDVVDLLLRRDAKTEAAHLTAAGYANTARAGWRDQLTRFADAPGLSRQTRRQIDAALLVREGQPVLPSAVPLPLIVAGSWATWLVRHVTDTVARAGRLVPGSTAVAAAVLDAVDVTGAAALSGLVSRDHKAYDPARCSCWETDWYSGPDARAYVEGHLESVTISESLGLVVRRCPSLDKTWLDLPDVGFTVTIDAPADSGLQRQVSPRNLAEEPSVGFYL